MRRPESVPALIGMEVYGETLSLNDIVGGDHLIYVDFKKRYDMDPASSVATGAGRPAIVPTSKIQGQHLGGQSGSLPRVGHREGRTTHRSRGAVFGAPGGTMCGGRRAY
jgi:hypothetical protein